MRSDTLNILQLPESGIRYLFTAMHQVMLRAHLMQPAREEQAHLPFHGTDGVMRQEDSLFLSVLKQGL